ncbi:MAG: 6-hydroxymethylpterin diphosphokinase MptE-like protein [Pseudomonadota bacterium]
MLSRKKYAEIKGKLDLNFGSDEKARDVLDSLVEDGDYRIIGELVGDKIVFIFGCGPSLERDVERLCERGLLEDTVLIAADGAVKALLEKKVVPNICVTDLDGNKKALMEASKKGCIMVIHAHGDNIQKLNKILPKLQGKKLGTTQVKPTRKIRNFGGFTDGNRAVYLAVKFKPKKIVLFGMDFGNKIGKYSGKRKNKELRIRKLEVGRTLLEELAGKTRISILNATSGGVEIKNVRRIRIEDLELE